MITEGGEGGTALAVIETSNNINNLTAYDALTPRSVLYWIRVVAANSLADSSMGWAELYTVEASGKPHIWDHNARSASRNGVTRTLGQDPGAV